ncbi:MAG: hypothetical protein GY816_01635 [Cytophagales bacterium]|nr:hypothetical protein [Cytophagales bacterium]
MGKKFSEKDLGDYVTDFYKKYQSNPEYPFVFDLSGYDRISNQNLLVLSSLIKYLYDEGSKAFKIKLHKTDPSKITERQAETLIQVWEVWKLQQIFNRNGDPVENYLIDNYNVRIDHTVKFLKGKYSKINVQNDIYDRLSITPFISLNIISDYKDESLLANEIEPVFRLNKVIQNEIRAENSEHPFVEKTISAIITRELYENFLDHYQSSFFKSSNDLAFMSISLKRKIGRNRYFLSEGFLRDFLPEIESKYPILFKFIYEQAQLSTSTLINLSKQEIDEISNEIKFPPKKLDTIRNEDLKNKQGILRTNFKDEELKESLNFFQNEKGNIRNEALIQFTFMDYGKSIPTTILPEFLKENGLIKDDNINQNEVLAFAFKHNTSRFPILDKSGKTDNFIPSGYFGVTMPVISE